MSDMTKAHLMRLLDEGRTAWEATLRDVPRERMTQTGVVGDWTVKDIVSHISFWERVSAGRLGGLVSGQPPTDVELYGAGITPEIVALDIDAFNAWQQQRDHDRALDEVLMDEQQAYRRLYTYVRAAREDDLLDVGRANWATESPAWENVAGNSYEHWAEHAASIRAWLEGGPA